MSKVSYASGVRSIMYGMMCSKPNLTYVISVISRFMANPRKTHCEVLKWTLRYLKWTTRLGLLFQKQEDTSQLVMRFLDSDFVGNLDLRKSLTVFVFTVFETSIC